MHKYNAKKTVVDGITFDSKLEACCYVELKRQKENGFVQKFKLQPEFLLQEGYIRNHDKKKIRPVMYVADFFVTYTNGEQWVIDCKGFPTPVYALKKKMFEFKYPDLKLWEVKTCAKMREMHF